MTDIVLPAVSPTMEKATLARWIVGPGSAIKRGDVIAEIETDKASVEIAAEQEGVIGELVVAAGTVDVPVGTVIARLGGVAGVTPPVTATGVENAASAREEKVNAPGTAAAQKTSRADATPVHEDGDALASPLSRRLARQLGIDLRQVQGTGQRGRITRADLERHDARLRAAILPSAQPAPFGADAVYPAPHGVPHETLPLSAMRKTIARRLGESKRSVPHFYMTVDVAMDALLALRKQCNERPGAIKLSLNDFIIRAVALSLQAVPAANVQYAGGSILRFQRVDISVAVAVPEGLYTPVVKDAASKGVQTIAQEMGELVSKAKSGKLHPTDYEGGTFSISNLGMYGIKQFEAVINPPQAAILAIGATERRVVPRDDDDGVRVVNMLSATLSCDHRVIDGAVGAALLTEIKRRLEDPLGLLLG